MKNSIIFISCILYSCTSTQINEKSIIQDDAFFELKKSHTYKTCETGVKNINNYNLINNQWGTFKLKRGKLKLCQYYKTENNKTIYGWEWDSPSDSRGVIAFPELQFSDSAIHFPLKYKSLKILTSKYNTRLISNNKYNLAFDIWLTYHDLKKNKNITIELMIWEDYNKFTPYGSKRKSMQTSFGVYDYYNGYLKNKKAKQDWLITSFVRKSKRQIGSVNLKEILDFLLIEKIVPNDFSISSIEFGTEILNSKGYILINDFEVNISENQK